MDEETEEYENHEEGKSTISADLIRGHINTIILRSLYDRDKYGYEIINEINEKSHGQYTLKQPTLYSALKRLENQGYIQAYWKSDEVSSGGRRKYFRLTEAGKEITEKNQAEWEYSRTVIDSLISDKNFDFSQPAPTPVDFRLLKQTTSRVPIRYNEDGEEITDEETNKPEEQQPVVQILAEPVIEALTFTSQHETSVVLSPEEIPEEVLPFLENPDEIAEKSKSKENEDEFIISQSSVSEDIPEESMQEKSSEEESVQLSETVEEETATAETVSQQVAINQTTVTPPTPVEPEPEPQPQPVYTGPTALEIAAAQEQLRLEREMAEEQRRIAHANYEKLISGELEKNTVAADDAANKKPNQQDLIYVNRPEPERDYKNLVDKLFENTLHPSAPPVSSVRQTPLPIEPEPEPQTQQPPIQVINQQTMPRRAQTTFSNAADKAASDGIKILTSENNSHSQKAARSTYNKGATLFKCSLIVGVIILLEFTLCLLFRDTLKISFVYPFVILALGIADILVCGILFGAGYGKQIRKPTRQLYIIKSIVATAILILIIVIFAIVLSVDWSSTPDVLAKVVVPCIIALNIPIFTLTFYLLTK